MKAVKEIDIYLVNRRNIRPIDVVQYDTGIQLEFTMMDFDIPSGATATMYVQKPSGKFVYQEDGITVSETMITVNLHNQAITEHGRIPYQVSLTSGSDVITTFTGLMLVEKSLKDAGATESKTVIRAFNEAVADHVAEFQTKAEQIVQACIATIPEDYTVMESKVNELANAIKGSLSGAVVRADDVSPVEHNPVVWVHGKNLFPHGTITFTKNQSYLLDNPIPAGTYTISAYITSSDTDSDWSVVSINHGNEVMEYLPLKRDERVSSTFTVEKSITNLDFCAAYNYSQGVDDSATWENVQIEKGDTATAYESYIDPSMVMVKRCGKNLLNLGDVRNGNGATSVNSNGKFTVTGYFASFTTTLLHSGERYSISFNSTRTGSAGGGIAVEFYNDEDVRITGIYKQNDLSTTVTFTVPENTASTRFYFYGSGSSSGTTSSTYTDVLLEFGGVATEYEPYNGEEYTPAADGTVSGVTSLSPNMTILTDTEGVIVECEYNRDTNKVVDRLVKAIEALGGTV